MSYRSPLRIAACLFVVFAVLSSATAVEAQRSIDARVRVAIPDRFPLADARAIVLRYSPAQPSVIILNAANATPETLAAALALLRHLDKARPPAPGRYLVAPLKGFVPLRRPDPAMLRHLDNQLAALRSQRSSRIGNIGRGRWIELNTPVARS